MDLPNKKWKVEAEVNDKESSKIIKDFDDQTEEAILLLNSITEETKMKKECDILKLEELLLKSTNDVAIGRIGGGSSCLVSNFNNVTKDPLLLGKRLQKCVSKLSKVRATPCNDLRNLRERVDAVIMEHHACGEDIMSQIHEIAFELLLQAPFQLLFQLFSSRYPSYYSSSYSKSCPSC